MQDFFLRSISCKNSSFFFFWLFFRGLPKMLQLERKTFFRLTSCKNSSFFGVFDCKTIRMQLFDSNFFLWSTVCKISSFFVISHIHSQISSLPLTIKKPNWECRGFKRSWRVTFYQVVFHLNTYRYLCLLHCFCLGFFGTPQNVAISSPRVFFLVCQLQKLFFLVIHS